MSRCTECEKMMCLQSNCQKCRELNEFDALMSGDATELPKIDLGQAVTPEEKQALWSEDDEKRIDIIGSNGNDGAVYPVTSARIIEKACRVMFIRDPIER